MSHAEGEVWKDGKLRGWYEYNGTCDVVCTRIYSNRTSLQEHWRGDNWRECTCGQDPEDVILYSEYGGGFHWPGTACFRCGAIIDGIVVDDIDTVEGRPAPK